MLFFRHTVPEVLSLRLNAVDGDESNQRPSSCKSNTRTITSPTGPHSFLKLLYKWTYVLTRSGTDLPVIGTSAGLQQGVQQRRKSALASAHTTPHSQ